MGKIQKFIRPEYVISDIRNGKNVHRDTLYAKLKNKDSGNVILETTLEYILESINFYNYNVVNIDEAKKTLDNHYRHLEERT